MGIMKYIVIFNEIPEKSSWFEADESWLQFQGVLINSVAKDKKDEALQKKLVNFIFDKNSGMPIIKMN